MIVVSSTNAFIWHGSGPSYGNDHKTMGFYLHTGEGWAGRCGCTLFSTFKMADDGSWQTVVVIKDSTKIAMHIDGTDAGSCTFTCAQTEMNSPGTLTLGGDETYQGHILLSPATRHILAGEVRNLEVFPCALSTATATDCTGPSPPC